MSLLAGESIVLSVLHHRFNFWGWPWDKQAIVIFLAAPLLALLIYYFLAPIWRDVLAIERLRAILFLFPLAILAAVMTWRIFSVPEVQHHLEILPLDVGTSKRVQLQEVRGAYSLVVPLSTFANTPGWSVADGLLTASAPSPEPIRYSFAGPISQPVRLTFLAVPDGGHVVVALDGNKSVLDLSASALDQRRVRLDTQFRWGFLNFLIVPLVAVADWVTFSLLFLVLWLIQELLQSRLKLRDSGATERFLSHRLALLLLCLLALVLHAINFLSVPLEVTKDSPSYLQGAIYWLQYHSLDGVSSYRGPGTTFLFTPFMALFGRNPWGLKICLHLLAMACVPISYRLGWQLGRRRWFAFCAGLLTALSPDLLNYASHASSEVPHFFFGLLLCTLLISALETPSFGWILAALVAGALAVLVRPENSVALALSTAFIVAKLLWERRPRKASQPHDQVAGGRAPATVWQVALAVMIASIPLLAWSAHNQRVYGFWGISDYAGEILYDGWIYFGQSSHLPIAAQDSGAVRQINAAYPPQAGDSEVPTGWTIYYALRQSGYTSEQAFSLLQRAAMDSIRGNLSVTWKLLQLKLQQGLDPQVLISRTFPLPGEGKHSQASDTAYFERESPSSPIFLRLQTYINLATARLYRRVSTIWLVAGLGMLFICCYRKPFIRWVPLAAISLNSILLPTVLGMSLWRYVVFGLLLLPIFILAGFQLLGTFLPYYLQAAGFRKSSPS